MRFRERSPGLITAVSLTIPGGIATLRDLSRSGRLTRRDLRVAILVGLLLNAAAVGSLRLNMPR